jgi:hypothetical protein
MAYEQLDEMAVGFYDRLPVIIECTIQIPRAGRWPNLSKVGDWVFRLLRGRLWFDRPNCIGLRAGILLIENHFDGYNRHGTEIVITRKDI